MTHKYDTLLFSKFITIFSSFFILSSTTDAYYFANWAVSSLNCIWMEWQYLTEECVGICQRIILSPGVFVEYNRRGTTDVIKVSLSLVSSNDCCLYLLCPMLPLQPHFEMGTDSFKVSSRTTSVAFFLSHYNYWSCFIHEGL